MEMDNELIQIEEDAKKWLENTALPDSTSPVNSEGPLWLRVKTLEEAAGKYDGKLVEVANTLYVNFGPESKISMPILTEFEPNTLSMLVKVLEHLVKPTAPESIAPVQIPTEEEIEAAADAFVEPTHHKFEPSERYGFIEGIKWMASKIKGGS